MNKVWVVYKITNNINCRYYIGVNKTDIDNIYNKYYGSGRLIKDAIRKYGIENFTKTILEYFDNEMDAYNFEKQIVQTVKINPLSYNLIEGGKGGKGRVMSEEQKINISRRHKGKKLSENQKRNHSISQKKRFENIEERQKSSEIMKQLYFDNPELKIKMSNKLKSIYENTDIKQKISTKLKEVAKWKEKPNYIENMSKIRKDSKKYICKLCNNSKSMDGGNFSKHCKLYHNMSDIEILTLKNS